eukprot:5726976-Prymnesium_polylepis.2
MLLDSLPYSAAVRGLVLGAIVGLIGLYEPDTLTWGEYQINVLVEERFMQRSVGESTVLALAKFFAIIFTVASGYGAGIVYPLIMVGYLFGPLWAAILGIQQPNEPARLSQDCVGPISNSDLSVELIGQTLGSGLLAATMRAPLGSALLVGFLGKSSGDRVVEPGLMCLLVLTNFIAVYANPRSGLGQVYNKMGQASEPQVATDAAAEVPKAQEVAEACLKGAKRDDMEEGRVKSAPSTFAAEVAGTAERLCARPRVERAREFEGPSCALMLCPSTVVPAGGGAERGETRARGWAIEYRALQGCIRKKTFTEHSHI